MLKYSSICIILQILLLFYFSILRVLMNNFVNFGWYIVLGYIFLEDKGNGYKVKFLKIYDFGFFGINFIF